jgi:hypothetical protein
MRSHYLVKVPPVNDQGNFTCNARASYMETMKQNALWSYNSARAHDGQEPLKKMPRGTTYQFVKGDS